MDTIHVTQNQNPLNIESIQYLPHHCCPKCQAPAKTTTSGAWLRPYQDWFGTSLRFWQDHLGYVYFQCECQHHRRFSGALRVACLGGAILPVHFVDSSEASNTGREPAQINAERVREAVAFLAHYADPTYTSVSDWLAHTLVAVAAGGLSPAKAQRDVQAWIDSQLKLALQKEQSGISIGKLVDLDLTDWTDRYDNPQRKELR